MPCGQRRSARINRTLAIRAGDPGHSASRDQGITFAGRTPSPGCPARQPRRGNSWPGAPAAGCPRARVVWQTAGVSSDNPADLHMLNVIVADMSASLDFYQRLGIAIPGEAAGDHVQLKMPGGFSLELDTAKSARLWHAG